MKIGSAGYGKTVLSTAIIEDLRPTLPPGATMNNNSGNTNVIYFHFNAQKPGQRSSCDALRAAAAQVIEILADNSDVMDLLSVWRMQNNDSRGMATEPELSEFLLLAVRRLPSAAFVFDGIDECYDFERLWPFLSATCANTRIKSLLLGRPQTAVPSVYTHLVQRHWLPGTNQEDIFAFFVREISIMQSLGQLDDDIHLESTADTLTSCANSSFLWAILIISYLRSPALSLSERRQEMSDPNRVVTMPRLYAGILRQFEALYPQDRNLLTKIFWVLVQSRRPPTIAELDVVISIEPGNKTPSKNLHSSLRETLHRLCGALIEIGPNSAVSFSHLAFRNFLLSDDATNMKSPFQIDLKSSSLWMSQVCLSYLVHDVPPGPLSGKPDTEADKHQLAAELPFLEYSARHWVEHTVDALRLMSHTLRELISAGYQLFQQLGSFLSNKSSISAWIETCWSWSFRPSVEPLWQELEKRLGSRDIRYEQDPLNAQTRKPFDHIQKIAEDLGKLEEQWSHLLAVRPYEIWGPSVSAFLGPMSWAYNHEATVINVPDGGGSKDFKETVLKV